MQRLRAIGVSSSVWCVMTLVGCATHGPVTDRPLPPDHPRVYTADHTSTPIVVDGLLDEPAWQRASWTADFIDIEGDIKPPPRHRTRAKMCWDDEYFYVAAKLDEPDLWGVLTNRDAIIYHDNDFEIFIDPDGDRCEYNEYEINVLGTEMDLRMSRPYRNGGNYDLTWDFEGVRSAISLRGTVNDPSNRDSGWTVEVAIPWSSMADTANVPCPPRARSTWWVNFSRVQWRSEVIEGRYQKIDGLREDNWVWSPQSAIDMHRPEYWGLVQFIASEYGADGFSVPVDAAARSQMRRLIAAVEQYQSTHSHGPNTLSDLPIANQLDANLPEPVVASIDDRAVIVQRYRSPAGMRRLVCDEFGCLHDTESR